MHLIVNNRSQLERELHPLRQVVEQIGSHPLREWIEQSQHPVVVSHKNADGDAVGSLLSWYHHLNRRPRLILPNGCPKHFTWLSDGVQILSGDTDLDVCRRVLQEADLILCVDFCDLTRIEQVGPLVKEASGRKVLIDHHHQPEQDSFDLIISIPDLSSTCELTYWVMHHLWGDEKIGRETARSLYTGICTDTGSFSYSSEHPSVYEAAAALVSKGIDAAGIHLAIDNTFTEERIRFYGHILSNRLRVFPESHFAYMYVTLDDVERFHMEPSDMEGLVSYTMMMRDVWVGVLVREEVVCGTYRNRISLRSKYDTDVNQIARTHFNGGGHTKAAGGQTTCRLEETLSQLEAIFIGNCR